MGDLHLMGGGWPPAAKRQVQALEARVKELEQQAVQNSLTLGKVVGDRDRLRVYGTLYKKEVEYSTRLRDELDETQAELAQMREEFAREVAKNAPRPPGPPEPPPYDIPMMG